MSKPVKNTKLQPATSGDASRITKRGKRRVEEIVTSLANIITPETKDTSVEPQASSSKRTRTSRTPVNLVTVQNSNKDSTPNLQNVIEPPEEIIKIACSYGFI